MDLSKKSKEKSMSDLEERVESVEPSLFEREEQPTEEAQEQESQEQEALFDVDGEQVAFSKLSPEQVNKWYEAETQRNEWQRVNTQQAQKIAEQKKQWETEKTGFDENIKKYNILNDYIENNPELAQLIQNYTSNNQVQQPQQPQQQVASYKDPRLEEHDRRLQEIEQREQKRVLSSETEQALQNLREKDPNFDKEKFMKFYNETLNQTGTTDGLYQLFHDAMIGRSKNEIVKDTEQKVLENIKNKQTSVVETGTRTSATSLPDNVSIGGNLDDVFENFKKDRGILPETLGIED